MPHPVTASSITPSIARRLGLVFFSVALLGGCSSLYYNTMEKLGFEKRDILVDRVEKVSNQDAMDMAHRLMQEEGILCGISCGAAVVAAVRIGKLPEFKGKNIVVVLPDSAERYLSSALFAERFGELENVQ